jgi:hypothetical protein
MQASLKINSSELGNWEPGGEGEKQEQHESHNQRLKPDSENIPHLVILVK